MLAGVVCVWWGVNSGLKCVKDGPSKFLITSLLVGFALFP